jgi:hypothetical protein
MTISIIRTTITAILAASLPNIGFLVKMTGNRTKYGMEGPESGNTPRLCAPGDQTIQEMP